MDTHKVDSSNILTEHIVIEVMKDCVIKGAGEADSADMHWVTGTSHKVLFSIKALQINANKIVNMCNMLPGEFKKSNGTGWGVSQACKTRDGITWTTDSDYVEYLILLGLAIEKIVFMQDRCFWHILPTPYITVV